MKKLLLALIVIFISGCSSVDKVQAFNDCKLDALKVDDKDYDHYVLSCMEAKGYLVNKENQACYSVYAATSECWEYSWRVFLH